MKFLGAPILFIPEKCKMFLCQNKNKYQETAYNIYHSFIHLMLDLMLRRNFDYLSPILGFASRLKGTSLAFQRQWNFPKVMDRQGILESQSIISSKGTLKLSESTKIMGSFFPSSPHLKYFNSQAEERCRGTNITNYFFFLMALLEASKMTKSVFSLEEGRIEKIIQFSLHTE